MTRIQLRIQCIILAIQSLESSHQPLLPDRVIPVAQVYEDYISSGIDIPDNDEYFDDDDDDSDDDDSDDDPSAPTSPLSLSSILSSLNPN